MDVQTQGLLELYDEKLSEARKFDKIDPFVSMHIDDLGILLQLVREQETQLAKYERVIESAKNLIQKAREAKTMSGDNGQPDWYEYSASNFDALLDAVDALEEST